MTREEAIRVIENRDSIMDYCESAQLGEALDVAIEVLSAIEDIKAEIEASKWVDKDIRMVRNALASGLDKALEIIDKYTSGEESE